MTAGEVIQKLEGEIYQSPLSPKETESASSIIIPATNSVIAALKKAPHDLHNLSPRKFEEVIADLLRGMGWDTYLTPATRDGGMDILAYLNTPLGRLLCIVEAKHYRPDRPVGVQLVRNLYGVFCDREANSSLLVTSSYFTPDAMDFQSRHKHVLELRDYAHVIDWIRNHND
jgi:restriction system protein